MVTMLPSTRWWCMKVLGPNHLGGRIFSVWLHLATTVSLKLYVFVWVLTRYSGFLPMSKDMLLVATLIVLFLLHLLCATRLDTVQFKPDQRYEWQCEWLSAMSWWLLPVYLKRAGKSFFWLDCSFSCKRIVIKLFLKLSEALRSWVTLTTAK